MVRLELTIKVEEPLILANKPVGGNIVHTLDYITGSALRGAFAARYLSLKGLSEKDEFRQFFWSNEVRFGNLYPESEGDFVFPLPISAKTCKGYKGFKNDDPSKEIHGISDYLLHEIPESCFCNAPLENYPCFYEFFPNNYSYCKKLEVGKRFSVHSEIEDKTKRSKEGILYTLEHINEEEKFLGNIIFSQESVYESFKKLFFNSGTPISFKIGQARSRGMGKVIETTHSFNSDSFFVTSKGTVEERVKAFNEGNLDNNEITFSLTLFSDAIICDKFLRYLTTIPEWIVGEELNILSGKIEKINAFTAYRMLSGWNAALGIPKENEIVINKGSSFLYTFKGSGEENDRKLIRGLEELENRGIGFRRNEGFGEIIVCDPVHLYLRELEENP
jgi:CRISPR-associated protein Csx10